jgi:ABC-type dipeptide/oligopeptide/nickel transport system ATPase component
MPLLDVRGLTTRFRTERGELTAVDDVSFSLEAGETLAIVGESGSGKSVTAMSLMRLIPNPPGQIVAGEILFEGQDLLKLPDAQMREIRGNRIAMIFQEPMSSLNPALTVGMQIAEPVNVHRKEPWARAFEVAPQPPTCPCQAALPSSGRAGKLREQFPAARPAPTPGSPSARAAQRPFAQRRKRCDAIRGHW